MDDIIKTVNLTKYFGKVHAVENISLTIRKGEIFGFLGLNGAGKTTTIRMLLGMVGPTSGAAYLMGKRVRAGDHELWSNVGYLVEMPHSYPELTVWENLEIIRRLRFIPEAGAVDSVIEKLRLGPYRDRIAKNLSLGNAQRLGLAKAIIHNPDILILDEPANGLDPVGIVEIREMLHDLAFDKDVTIFISSHILAEISKFATRIGIIHEGSLIQELDTDQLGSLIYKKLQIHVHDKDGARSFLEKEGYSVIIAENGFLEITNKEAIIHPENVNSLLVYAGYLPTMLRVEEENLESYFLRIIGKKRDI